METLVARGEYAYRRSDGDVGRELWELHEGEDGTAVWRSDVEEERGYLLTHLLCDAQGRPDRLQLRWHPKGGAAALQTIYTFFDDGVLVLQGNERDVVELPPQWTLMGLDVGSRALALPPLAGPEGRLSQPAEPLLQLVFTVQLRGDTFRSRLVKWAFYPLEDGAGLDGEEQGRVAAALRLAVPGLPEQRGWFDPYGVPVRWLWQDGGEQIEARLTRYSRGW